MAQNGESNRFYGMDHRTFPEAGSAVGEERAETVSPSGCSVLQKNDSGETGEKIDLFCHILPKKYNEALLKKSRPCYNHEINSNRPALTDLELRFKTMDKFDGLKQVLTLGAPPIEFANSLQDAVDLARMANDEMAELLNKYPGRFVAAVASLPMSNVDASLREADRAVHELNFKGVQIFSSINGKPLDSPEFLGLYEIMARHDLPILIHPVRDRDVPDYPGEKSAKYTLFLAFGWPFDTTIAVGRLVFSGILEKYPNLKIVTHHCGAMIPFFSSRIPSVAAAGDGEIIQLTRPPVEYFKMLYGDTCLGGNTPALMCGYDFFGADHMVFSTDYPYPPPPPGEATIEKAIASVVRMNVTDEEKEKIFSKNVRRLLKLS